MKCPLCGAEVSADDLFCGSCGHNLLQERPEAEEKAAPAEAPSGEAAPSEVPAEPATLPPVPPAAEPVPEKAPEAPRFELPTTPAETIPPVPTAKAKDNTWRWILVIAVVLLVLLCCCCATMLYFFYWSSSRSQPQSWLPLLLLV